MSKRHGILKNLIQHTSVKYHLPKWEINEYDNNLALYKNEYTCVILEKYCL